MRARILVLLALPLPATAAEAADPLAPQQLARILAGLVLVVLVIAATAWGLRRLGRVGLGGGGVLRVVAALPVGARERLLLVEVGGEQILIGVAPGRIQRLHTLAEPVAAPAPAAPGGFAARLREALGAREAGR
ncbi:flagellar biosynthetic protein FliO [Inmirania thermothiophila]|uniref:flagellar biosynthetic protein FliO n=1 Tax=Inmirania thermothiophila TaxID=1750597 RepID=UPI001B884342|nr:flagellar biosynthetic protein FliO [Inmirania thermothiophila]